MMTARKRIRWVVVALIAPAWITWGCRGLTGRLPGPELASDLFTEEVPVEPPPERAEASLWDSNIDSNFLFRDNKARRVNDIVTVQVTENSSAIGNVRTSADRESGMNIGFQSGFGGLTLNQNARSPVGETLLDSQFESEFEGTGSTARDTNLTATMTAVVRRVYPNGNLYIEGRRQITVNDEDQYMLLSGVIRPSDIGPNNTVSSSLIADARILYSGKGVLSDKQMPGIGNRLLDYVWPF